MDINESKESIETAQLHLRNIVDGSNPSIRRFIFTPSELRALSFIDDLLSAHLKELELELK